MTPGATPVVGGVPVVVSPVAGPTPVIVPTLVVLDPAPLDPTLLAGRPVPLQGTRWFNEVPGGPIALSRAGFPVVLDIVEPAIPDVRRFEPIDPPRSTPAARPAARAAQLRPYVAPAYPRKQDRH